MNIIFDLDGTLADCEHRRHLVSKDRRDPQWDEFFRRCTADKPIRPIINIFNTLVDSREHSIALWSGRSEAVRTETEHWIRRYIGHDAAEVPLLMRPIGENTPDDELKELWLSRTDVMSRPHLVFDDRNKVVAMWRRHGITCVQVAEGDF